ncbi:MAG: hypothetical protein D6679_04900 [Candidatus Hydrogenedentota bacterium]|nr:MAG: hypothetical protein D6679_04900 [Candidatus Hydrogenedentota bacterium]
MNGGYFIAAVPLLLAAAGPFLGHGWLGFGLYKIALLLLPFLYGKKLRPPRPPKRPETLPAILSGLVLGGVAFGLVWLFLPLFIAPGELRHAFDVRYGYSPATAAAAALLIATANALLEEWFYRGFLDEQIGPPASAFCFALQHVIVLAGLGSVSAALCTGAAVYPAGLVWSFLSRGGRIQEPFLSHVAADLVLLGGGLFFLGYF